MIVIADKIVTGTDNEPLDGRSLLLRGDSIVEIGPQEKLLNSHSSDRVLRLEHSILLPGLVNVHTHLELPDLGISGRHHSYASWVLKLLKAKAKLGLKDYRSVVRTNIKDSIRSGTTTIGDISTHGVSGPILRESGLRAFIYYEIIAMRPDRKLVFPRRFRDTSLIRHGLSPHSPHTVSKDNLRNIQSYARMRNIPLCMHVAESSDERLLLLREKSGLDELYAAVKWDREWAPQTQHSTFDYLYKIGVLSPGFLAVHAVQVDSSDIRTLAKSGSSVAHCPRSNSVLRSGTMDLRRMLTAGVPVGLGTDSLASVPTLSMWDEMRFALKLHKATGVTSKDVFHLATQGGANALGIGREIGSLEPGKRADIIAVPLPRRSTGDLYSDLLRETKSSIMTMVNGKVLYHR